VENAGRLTGDRALLRMGTSGWAWEWLRRNKDYVRAARQSVARRLLVRARPLLEIIELENSYEAPWGVCFSEQSDHPFSEAGVFWRADVDPSVIPVAAVASPQNPDAIDLCSLDVAVRILKEPRAEHVLLSNGFHTIQIHVVDGTVLNGAVQLAYVLPGPDNLNTRLLPLQRLAMLQKQKRFPAKMFLPDSHASRWLLALKAIDFERAGLSHPEIAMQLYHGEKDVTFATDWRRSRLRRLLDTGHAMINGNYLKILARSAKQGRRTA